MMRLATLILWLAASAAHAAGAPIVRIEAPDTSSMLPGQPITVNVKVLVPNFFMSPLQFPALDIPGAIVSMPQQERGVHFSEQIDGQAYAGIQRSLTILPLQTGTFALPAAQITFSYAAVPGRATPGAVTLPQTTFKVALPPGIPEPDGSIPLIPLAMTQSLDGDPAHMKVGGALTRSVQTMAHNVPAMVIPPPSFEAPAGLRMYGHDPVLSDTPQGGQRTDSVTYVFEQAGDFTLPAVTLDWYDTSSGKVETARAPEVKVQVASAASAAPGIPPPAAAVGTPPWYRNTANMLWIACGLAAIVLALALRWLARRYIPSVRSWRAERRHVYDSSEPAYFANCIAACRSGDEIALYQALERWAQRAGVLPLASWAQAFGGPALLTQIQAIEKKLFKPHDESEQNPLVLPRLEKPLKNARKAWLDAGDKPTAHAEAVPPLNPFGSVPGSRHTRKPFAFAIWREPHQGNARPTYPGKP